MSQARKIVEKTITDIRETTDLFYQQKTKEAYQKMQELTINSILQVVDALHEYKIADEAFPLEEERIVASLTDAMNAMESGDTVLLSDILEYDFIEYLQELLAQMD